jgi:hypothetical protein
VSSDGSFLTFTFLFILSESTLLLAPLLGASGASLLRRPTDHTRRRWVVGCIVVGIATIAALDGWSFRGVLADAVVVSIAYAIYCLGAFSLLRLRPRMAAIACAAVALLPVAFGYIGATIGILGVGLALGDEVPIYETDLTPRISCRVRTFGNATTSDEGYVLELFHHPWPAPFLEKRIATKRIDDSSIPRTEPYQDTPIRLCRESGRWQHS